MNSPFYAVRFNRIFVAFIFGCALSSAFGGVATVEVGPLKISRAAVPQHMDARRFQLEFAPVPPHAYQAKYSTIGHKILRGEEGVGTVTDDMYRLLDTLIDEAKTLNLSQDTSPAGAVQALKKMDDLLIRHGFVYPPVGLTQLLSDGMTPKLVDAAGIELITRNPHNARRITYVLAHKDKPFYYVDCDTASFLYLAIAEELKLPLFLVEVPEHNFARWYFADQQYTNWETMDGVVRSDEYYKIGFAIPEALVKNGVFLSKMTSDDTLGYCHFVVGGSFEQKKEWKQALDEYVLATQQYSRSPGTWNNVAWLLTTARDNSLRNGPKAVECALKAVSIYSSANNLDTLGCAYAESGDFAKAIATETEAYQLDSKDEYKRTLDGFVNHKTWVQQNPDQPGTFLVINANR